MTSERFGDLLRDGMNHARHIGGAAGRSSGPLQQLLKREQQRVPVPTRRAHRRLQFHGVGEGHEAHRVALPG